MNDFYKLFLWCDSDIEKMIAHIIDLYESGKGCLLCEHTGYCKQQRSAAICAHGITEYIRRMDDGEPEQRGSVFDDNAADDDCEECSFSGLLAED